MQKKDLKGSFILRTIDAILNRKSVRTYTGKLVSDADLKQLLKTAYASPVSMGEYSHLTLTVVTAAKWLQKLDQNAQKTFHTDKSMLYGAPLFIIVSTKLQGTPADNGAYSNAATIVENMNIEAVELGLGACHIWGVTAALAQNHELMREMKVPDGQTPVAGLVVGETTEAYTTRNIPMDRINTIKLT